MFTVFAAIQHGNKRNTAGRAMLAPTFSEEVFMKKLKDLFLPYTLKERGSFYAIIFFVCFLMLGLGFIWHPVFWVFAAIMAVFLLIFTWAAFRCKHCDSFLWGITANANYCPYCGKPL